MAEIMEREELAPDTAETAPKAAEKPKGGKWKNMPRKKRRRIIVTVSIVAVLALAIFFAVRAAKRKVSEAVGSMNAPTVSEATVTTGSISTTVSGSGMLADADTQQIVLPKGVKLEKILVKAGESVKKGDALATVELSSVMGAMSDVQAELDKLDEQLRAAAGETVQPSSCPPRGRRYLPIKKNCVWNGVVVLTFDKEPER